MGCGLGAGTLIYLLRGMTAGAITLRQQENRDWNNSRQDCKDQNNYLGYSQTGNCKWQLEHTLIVIDRSDKWQGSRVKERATRIKSVECRVQSYFYSELLTHHSELFFPDFSFVNEALIALITLMTLIYIEAGSILTPRPMVGAMTSCWTRDLPIVVKRVLILAAISAVDCSALPTPK